MQTTALKMMGCFNSKKLKSAAVRSESKRSRGSGKRYLPQEGDNQSPVPSPRRLPERPDFTDRQKELVLDTWKSIQEDIAKVGVVMFMRINEFLQVIYPQELGIYKTTEQQTCVSYLDLCIEIQNNDSFNIRLYDKGDDFDFRIVYCSFISRAPAYGVYMSQLLRLFETHPDVQDVFMPFRGQSKEDLSHSTALRSHALRVMGTVEKCLARINEPKKMEELLHDLGAKHVIYNAKVDYIDLIGPQFIWAIEPAMKERWTPEIEQAWSDLFKLIAHIIKEAMLL